MPNSKQWYRAKQLEDAAMVRNYSSPLDSSETACLAQATLDGLCAGQGTSSDLQKQSIYINQTH